MTRRKIAELFEGYDVELIASFEQSLTFAGKQLEDELTVADYNIQKGNEIHMTFGLDGGVIVKKHATKKEKLKNLQMRSIEHISKEKEMNISFEIPSVDIPPAMNNVLQPMRDKLERAKAMSSQDLFANIFANLPDKSIEQLEEVICNLYTITSKYCFTFKNIIIWNQI
jgi:predicted peroxiredoxin